MNDKFVTLYAGFTEKTDEVFCEAVSAALGEGWKLEDLVGRMQSIKSAYSTFETVLLDGKPILELHKPELITGTREMAETVTIRRKYRILVKGDQ